MQGGGGGGGGRGSGGGSEIEGGERGMLDTYYIIGSKLQLSIYDLIKKCAVE